jgi:hypothetical protein
MINTFYHSILLQFYLTTAYLLLKDGMIICQQTRLKIHLKLSLWYNLLLLDNIITEFHLV